MQQFEIVLKNEKLKSYQQISWSIIIVHIIVFLYLAIFSSNRLVSVNCLVVLAILAIFFFLRFYFIRTRWQFGFHPFFIVLILGWLNMYQYWMAVIPLAFDILGTIAARKLIAVFSEEMVVYPSFPKKKIQWTNLSNTILKDGLLTIDFKNNKLIQQAADETKTIINEQEFNDFCRQQLSLVNSSKG
jgi:hypothetical protein